MTSGDRPPDADPAAPGTPAASDTERAPDPLDSARYPPPQFAPAAHAGVDASARGASDDTAAGARSGRPPAPPSSEAAADEPLLPATADPAELRAAVGLPARSRAPAEPAAEPDPDAEPERGGRAPGRRGRRALALAAGVTLAAGAAAIAVLGRINAASYHLVCEPTAVVAEQGRQLPPWGTRRLTGPAWKPIPIPASFVCAALTTTTAAEVGDAFGRMLLARAEALLTGRDIVELDAAAAMLEQALLHARSDRDAHKVARQEIDRLLGDVGYWRASAKVREAATALDEAARAFDAAAAQRPRHVSDAAAWAARARRAASDLRAAGAPTPGAGSAAAAPGARPQAPLGVALPVEPARGAPGGAAAGGPAAGSGAGGSAAAPAQSPAGPAGSASAPEAPPGPAVPSGGVLL
jgi:hypothetical protein